MISFMDAVAKRFGCNVSMGQTYWEALTTATFATKTCMFHLIWVSLALDNLISDKLEDGVARLLSKADVAKVAAKPKLASVTEAESTMQNALEIANSLGGIDIVLKPLGQLFVRVGLLITDKGKQGRKHTVFTLQKI